MRPAPLWSETRILQEPLRLLLSAPRLSRAPRGEGTVMLIPGYRTTDRSLLPLAMWLRHLGYSAHGWGLGRNEGAVGAVMPALQQRLESLGGAGPVALIGWSWGGTLARSLGRSMPERVSQIITMGAPIQGGAAGTVFASRMSAEHLQQSAQAAAAREVAPLLVPAMSIYTEHDGVVAWQASRDPRGGQTAHLQVDSCHIGLGLSPAVWLAIAARLAGSAA